MTDDPRPHVCRCGHTNHQHGPTKAGRCEAGLCQCPKFVPLEKK